MVDVLMLSSAQWLFDRKLLFRQRCDGLKQHTMAKQSMTRKDEHNQTLGTAASSLPNYSKEHTDKYLLIGRA
jgi:hypothetical protein